MTPRECAKQVIRAIHRQAPLAECSCCRRAFRLDRANLFYVNDPTPDARKRIARRKDEIAAEHRDLRQRRAQISQSSEVGARAVNAGFLFERLGPTLPGFPFNPRDVRPLGDPLDAVIFDGITEHGIAKRIVLCDFKSGEARLSGRQRSIREAVEKGRLEFDVYG